MTPRQIELVQNSFEQVVPIKDQAAEMFYNRLFELDPSLRGLFKGDMKQQGQKLMTMLASVVRGLNVLDEIIPEIKALGVRHAGYAVLPRHYPTVGAALLWTLEQGLGEGFTDETKQAWSDAYAVLSSTMTEAAASQAA
ncbi:MAG: globin family protein [Alphaproteobacteria bacterium]